MKRTALVSLLLSCAFACGDGCKDEDADSNGENTTTNSFSNPVGEWTPEACEGGEDEDGDGHVDCADADCYVVDICTFDPSNISAPDLPLNGVVSFWERSRWLLETGGPQRGVVDAAVTEHNIGTVRGRLLSTDGAPLAGAAISIGGHADLGRTYTRDDGTFDMAFDVGRRLVLRVAAAGYITSDREVRAQLKRATSLGDIVLVPNENEATSVDFGETTYVGGTQTSDADGTRATVVIIHEGTRAKLDFPNGASRPLPQMHVRATEVTVGETGREAMMAELPPGTLYTYAAEFTVDEAVEQNATGVTFDRPVFIYVDNFLGFSPGTAVPSGYYDRERFAWDPMPNGIVVEIRAIESGRAVLAISDDPIDREAASELGVTDDELELLAENYEVGDTLWRVPTLHFSPFDLNWGGIYPPNTAPSPAPGPSFPDQCTSGQKTGSMIGCSNQTLGEQIRLNGTPFTLTYQSGRVPGRKPVITVPVMPRRFQNFDKLLAAQVRVTAAGQVVADEVYREIGDIPQVAEFVWDGNDQFGRPVQGAAEVDVEVALVYLSRYLTRWQVPRLEGDIPPASEFGGIPVGDGVTAEQSGRALWVLRRRYTETPTAGTYDVTREGLGGWTLDAQHRYDPIGRVMYYGNGQDLPAGPRDQVFRLVGGAGAGFSGTFARPEDGADASEIAVPSFGGGNRSPIGNDGTIYYHDVATVRAIDPATNQIYTVAGQPHGDVGFDLDTDNEDGIAALDARFDAILQIRFGKDNRLYIMTDAFIWRLESDGTLSKLVGRDVPVATLDGAYDELADGVDARHVAVPWRVMDASADGTLYVVGRETIYRRTADGLLRAVAPVDDRACEAPPCGDGEPALITPLREISAMAVSPSGDIYFAEDSGIDDLDRGSYIRRIRADGILETLAEVPEVRFLEVGPAAAVYFSVNAPNIIIGTPPTRTLGAGVLRLTDEGEVVPRIGIFQEAGTDLERLFGFYGDEIADGESTLRPVDSGNAFSISPSGQFVLNQPGLVFTVDELFPGHSGRNYQIPLPGGGAIDEYSPKGQHLATYEALTGTQRWEFEYDDAGRLLRATDTDGDMSTVERNAGGTATLIVGPDGVGWRMEMDAQGMLARLTSPTDDTWSFEYDDGLMTAMTNPRGESWSFAYDDAGRLLEDAQPNGGAATLERDPVPNEVLFTSPEGRETVYGMTPPGQALRYTSVQDGQLFTKTQEQRDGWSKSWTQDGTTSASRRQSHPVYGMLASYDVESWVETPSGLRVEREVLLTAETAGNELVSGLGGSRSTRTMGDTVVEREWNPDARAVTVTTGEGRSSTVTLNEDARPSTLQIPGVEPVSYRYDARGRVEVVTQGTRELSLAYDSGGYLAAVTTDDGTTALSRDSMGRIEEATRVTRA